MKKNAQSALEVIILVGFVSMLLIPLGFFLSHRSLFFSELHIQESIESVKENVALLRTLGPSSAKSFVINLPKGSYVTTQQRVIKVMYNDKEYAEELPVELAGGELLGEGIQHVNIYYDGKRVVIKGCGNAIIDPGEACEPSITTCIGSSRCSECQCTCETHGDCQSNLCNMENNLCQSCTQDADCPVIGSRCVHGKCESSSTEV